ncbi:ABC transporter substrate-binding protein [Pollutimonas nitritireducens]|uniref:ABC transporter substrate-binding protein n=1 Tax=Pollutimonas nitritireducens TaxID=2045209 RepID=A0A2N4UBI5_9BURK|nr:tripartite tricarboxylate transporter substrate binding protein [Pollutimonas nitritireducens]PLC52382.1 ABC transporter substrate-binding protein [Pollutimonas nitritireducens]
MFKKTLKWLGVGLGLAAATVAHAASDYPNRPITLIIPVAAGGTTDIAGRALAKQLKDELGQPVVVENRPGASGSIANSYVARAQPDGYTLVLSYEGFHTGNPVLMKDLSWDPVKDFTPIAEVIRGPHLFLVPANSPAKTLQEFIELAKRKPGSMNFASSGVGSIQHLGGELFQLKTDTDMVHVPYSGAAPAMQDLLAGRIDVFITTPPTAMAHVEAGTLRALAITSNQRHPKLPNIPTTAEAGLPEFQLEAWFSVFGPARMPADVVEKLAGAMQKVITSDEFKSQMSAQGSNASYRSPGELGQIVKDDLAKWSEVVKTAGIAAN